MSLTGGLMLCRPSVPLRSDQGISLLSDLHLGSPQTDEGLIKKELDQAFLRKDRINFNGDLFDAILAGDAKRYRPDAIHPRLHGTADVLGLALDWAEELLSPYVDHVDMIGIGNHETSVEKHHSLDLVGTLVKRLQTAVRVKGHRIHYGGYAGFLRYKVERSTEQKQGHRSGDSLTIFYWHGHGGGSGLGGALGEFASKGSFIEQADIHWHAHRHIRLAAPVERISCSASSAPASRTCWYIRTAAYMNSYSGQTQEHWLRKGRKSNYGADALHAPYGRGGARVVLCGSARKLRVELTSE